MEGRIILTTLTQTNAPTITIGKIFMNDAEDDEIGIRGTSGNNLAYTNGQRSRWFGSDILNKPIGDFLSSSNRFGGGQSDLFLWVYAMGGQQIRFPDALFQ